ncbi:MAG: D-tyrosyl-tRNA(Tyr) deacylase [Anaerolineaceae bacterium 4572_32.1]|nr:MAG: D-tyrosyl-tRNA(Tyr) deacylase [Anaerolineaceae bacterium 4572_32.1]
MRAVLQRVSRASVTVEGRIVGRIDQGLMILLGVKTGDTEAEAGWLARKIAGLRIFSDAEGKFNLSVRDAGGSALVVSQFTLYGDARKGRRPSFIAAARPEVAEPLVERFVEFLRAEGVSAETGVFGAIMQVEIHNDGPVTLILEK